MTDRPRVVFAGTPEAAVPSLHAVADVADVVAVLTRPDRPRGRGRRPRPTPVAEAAETLGLPVLRPASRAELRALFAPGGPLADEPLDLGVVVAYGMILPADVLAVPRRGWLNVHLSALPRWRGAAPVQRAILAGDATTGVSLMALDEGLDTGPLYLVETTPIGEDEDAGALTERLARRGAELVREHLAAIADGRMTPVGQQGEATVAPRIDRDELRLDRGLDADAFVRRVRAFSPRPAARIETPRGPLQVLAARPAPDLPAPGPDAPLLATTEEGRLVTPVADGWVELLRVRPAGKGAMTGEAYARGRPDLPSIP